MKQKLTSLVMGIDTSCDETSLALIKDGKTLLANNISSQIRLHAKHGGVVPELASRAHMENLVFVINETLKEAGVACDQLSGLAVTTSPGLIGCLLVGLSFTKAFSYALQIPYTPVHHLKAHLFSPFLNHPEVYPFLGLVVSGGHTALYFVKSFEEITCIGHTVDDAAGEAYDKVAKLLKLGYPGGPILDRLAAKGDPHFFSFSRAKVKKDPLYLSFSGLKTAVLHIVKAHEKDLESESRDDFIANLAASFQEEVVGSLMEKIERALVIYPAQAVLISGGVAMNSRLRQVSENFSKNKGIPVLISAPGFCTDNGAMVAYVGARQLAKGFFGKENENAFATSPLW